MVENIRFFFPTRFLGTMPMLSMVGIYFSTTHSMSLMYTSSVWISSSISFLQVHTTCMVSNGFQLFRSDNHHLKSTQTDRSIKQHINSLTILGYSCHLEKKTDYSPRSVVG